jgi:hypothetical protein
MASSAGSLTVPKEPRSLSLSKGARYFVHNERRMWKTTINGISCLTSLKRKQRFFKYMFTIHTLFLRLRFRLVKICNKKLCLPRALATFAHLQSFPWACRRGLSQTVYLYRRLRIRLWKICFVSVKFRVNPWQMLLLVLISVANFLLLLILPSVKFRVSPWQMLLLLFPSVANSASFRVNPWLIFSLLLPLLSVYSVLKPSRWGWVN